MFSFEFSRWKFYLQEQEFVIGSARLEKTFESIESSWWLTSACQLKQGPHPVLSETLQGWWLHGLPGQPIPGPTFERANYWTQNRERTRGKGCREIWKEFVFFNSENQNLVPLLLPTKRWVISPSWFRLHSGQGWHTFQRAFNDLSCDMPVLEIRNTKWIILYSVEFWEQHQHFQLHLEVNLLVQILKSRHRICFYLSWQASLFFCVAFPLWTVQSCGLNTLRGRLALQYQIILFFLEKKKGFERQSSQASLQW